MPGCLAEPGRTYAVYLPNTGKVTIRLAAGTYYAEWFNPMTGDVIPIGAADGREQDSCEFVLSIQQSAHRANAPVRHAPPVSPRLSSFPAGAIEPDWAESPYAPLSDANSVSTSGAMVGKTAVEYVDIGWSGAKASRPEFDRLMQNAGKRSFDVVLSMRGFGN
jgi:hypothetical protein